MLIKERLRDDKFLALLLYETGGQGEYCPASYFCKKCRCSYPPKEICINKLVEYLNSNKDNDDFIIGLEEDYKEL